MRERDDNICPESSPPGGEHLPDWRTLQPVKDEPGLVDVFCSKCGRSGSVRIDTDDLWW